MRFGWGYVSIIGTILAVFGIMAIIIKCPLLALFPPFVVGEPCDPSGVIGMVGLIMAASGAALVVFTEVARRFYHPPNAATGASYRHRMVRKRMSLTQRSIVIVF